MSNYDAAIVKAACAGRMVEVLSRLGVPIDHLDGKNHPCPKCGGRDRFAAFSDVNETGGCNCRKCPASNPDIFASAMWLSGSTFPDAVKEVAEIVGAKPKQGPNGQPKNGRKKKPQARGKTYDAALASLNGMMAKSGGKRAGEWFYHDAGERPVGAVIRYDMPTPEGEKQRKEFRPLRCENDQWFIGGMAKPWSLYQLPELLLADRVYIPEGEKAVDALRRIGLTATTSPQGASGVKHADWTPLAGRECILLADNDDAGRKRNVDAIAILRELEPPPVIKAVELPGLPVAGDAVDFIEQHDAQTNEDLRELIEGMAEAANNVTTIESSDRFYKFVDSKTFAETEYRLDFLIDNLLVEGQPIMFAGPKKSMKTSLIVEAATSVASGHDFLGKFSIRKPSRVCVMSGESGMPTLQETAFRVCKSKGIRLQDQNILWSDQTPQFGSQEHLSQLELSIVREGCEVLIIDPLYFCIPDVDAANLMSVGAQLRPVAKICRDANVTLFLCHHSRKNSGTAYEPLELADIAGAGMGEFARQWWLINRREAYELGSGDHRIWFGAGGSAGHSGLWAVDIEEGVFSTATQRSWLTEVKSAEDARREAQERKRSTSEEKKAEAYQAQVSDAEEKFERAFNGTKELSKTALFTRAGVTRNTKYGDEALGNLLRRGELEHCELIVGNNGRKSDGFRRLFRGNGHDK